MRILFIHNNYAGNNSGEEHAAEGLASLLESQGHEIKWYRRSSDEIAGTRNGQIKAFFTGVYNPFAVSELKEILKDFDPNLVQVQNLYPLISPAILKTIKDAGIPLVMRCPNYRLFCPNGLHLDGKGEVCEKCLGNGKELNCVFKNCEGNRFKSTGYALRNFMARKAWGILDYPDAYIVQSDFQRNKFIKNGIAPEKLFIIPGLTPIIETSPSLPGDLVSFVGRVSLEKGIVEFLEAARILPHIPFVVAGNLDKRLEYLKNQSSSNVSWMGFLKGKDLDDLYKNSRFIVVPGKWYEGFPNVITRAMQHARPVITSNLGAMASIIDHEKNGLLVVPGDSKELMSAIEKLYQQPSLGVRYGKHGRDKAQSQYSRDKVYELLSGLYSSLVSSKN
jgi:glycosyltransferase involved in cell wall biosynthesis